MRWAVMLNSSVSPSETLAAGPWVEQAGFERLWISEDLFSKGAFSTVGALLGRTERLEVGLGVASAYLRTLPNLAMEVATVAGMFPGRFRMGLGMGAAPRLKTIGRVPAKPVTEMRARLAYLRELINGGQSSFSDEFDVCEDVVLHFPAGVPIWMAAERPRMMQLAFQHADGLILSAMSSPSYIRWAARIHAEITGGPQEGLSAFPSVAFAYVSLAATPEMAYDRARRFLASRLSRARSSPLFTESGQWSAVEPLLGKTADHIAAQLTPEVVASFIPFGDPAGCAARLADLAASPVGEIALSPLPVESPTGWEPTLELLSEMHQRHLSGQQSAGAKVGLGSS